MFVVVSLAPVWCNDSAAGLTARSRLKKAGSLSHLKGAAASNVSKRTELVTRIAGLGIPAGCI